jgi:hypothetical protein
VGKKKPIGKPKANTLWQLEKLQAQFFFFQEMERGKNSNTDLIIGIIKN